MGDCFTMPVELTEEQIMAKPDSEKLAILIRLAFASYSQMQQQGEMLLGNGHSPGLIERVRAHSTLFIWLWSAFTAVSGVMITLITIHIFKG